MVAVTGNTYAMRCKLKILSPIAPIDRFHLEEVIDFYRIRIGGILIVGTGWLYAYIAMGVFSPSLFYVPLSYR